LQKAKERSIIYLSQKEKLLRRFFSMPNDFTYEELIAILKIYNFEEIIKGKTSGSRVSFYNKAYNKKIEFHRPHPGNIIKRYIIKNITGILKEMEVL